MADLSNPAQYWAQLIRCDRSEHISHPPPGRLSEGEGNLTMRILLILAGICFSANAFAQDAAPKAGTKPVKPKEPMGCKFVGTVKGTKLWAGDCMGPELRGAAPAAEPKQ